MINAVGIMMSKNESLIIGEVLEYYYNHDIPIIVMDDSDDGTDEIVKKYGNTILYYQKDVYGTNQKGSGDWMFQFLLEKKREIFGLDNYVILAMADELHHFDIARIIYDMREIEEADYAIVHSCQFFLKKGVDEKKWDFKKHQWKKPYNEMKTSDILKWYSPGYIAERRIFRDRAELRYADKQRFDPFPQGAINGKRYSKFPIIKHYPIQSPKQILERAKDRLERNYQPFYHWTDGLDERGVFLDNFPGFGESFEFNSDFGVFEKGMEYLK